MHIKVIFSPSHSHFCPLDLVQMTEYEALAMILDLGLTKEQYKQIRVNALKRNACIYPAYQHVLAVKELCTPPDISVSPEVIVAPMQSVLHHQVLLLSLYILCIFFSL